MRDYASTFSIRVNTRFFDIFYFLPEYINLSETRIVNPSYFFRRAPGTVQKPSDEGGTRLESPREVAVVTAN